MRITAAVLSSIVATLMIAGPSGSVAFAAQPDSAASNSCRPGTVKVPFISDYPYAGKPGRVMYEKFTIKNASRTTLTGLSFNYQFIPYDYFGHSAPTPSVYWRLGKGHWHKLQFTFHPGNARKSLLSYWDTEGNSLGVMKPHAQLPMEMKASFYRGDPHTGYAGLFSVMSTSCQATLGQGYIPFGF